MTITNDNLPFLTDSMAECILSRADDMHWIFKLDNGTWLSVCCSFAGLVISPIDETTSIKRVIDLIMEDYAFTTGSYVLNKILDYARQNNRPNLMDKIIKYQNSEVQNEWLSVHEYA